MIRELDSLDDLTHGYVLNFYSSPRGSFGNTIHPFNCHHVEQMSMNYRKIWADTVEELEEWIREQGAGLDPDAPRCGYAERKRNAPRGSSKSSTPGRGVSKPPSKPTASLYAPGKVLKTITSVKPLLAQWEKSTHPAQIRLYKYLEWIKAEVGELNDSPGDLFLHLDVAVADSRKLLKQCDLENYLTPLFDRRCLSASRFSLVSARKFVGDESKLTIGIVRSLVAPRNWNCFQFSSSANGNWKVSLHEKLKESGATQLPPGGVDMHLAWRCSRSINWVAQWKSTGDALGPILGYSNPEKPFHPLDDRITSLALHRSIDDACGKEVSLGIWWKSATPDIPASA
jgi:hypothetical protein